MSHYRKSLKDGMREESPGQFWRRVRAGGGRKPLRTFKELADEFGVPVTTLAGYIGRDPTAPKLIMRTGNRNKTVSWYDPDAMRAWWAARNEGKGNE